MVHLVHSHVGERSPIAGFVAERARYSNLPAVQGSPVAYTAAPENVSRTTLLTNTCCPAQTEEVPPFGQLQRQYALELAKTSSAA